MFLTPPDIISQTLLALPMWLLFEAGIFFSRFFMKRKDEFSKASEARYKSDDSNSGTTAGAGAAGAATFADDEALADSEIESELKKSDQLDDDEVPGP